MGVLDDAIREHLDLKRKHGAPEEELRRQEEEALGPVRREVEPPREETEASGNGEAPEAVLEPAPEQVAEPDSAPFDGEAPSRGAEARGGALESFDDEAASAERPRQSPNTTGAMPSGGGGMEWQSSKSAQPKRSRSRPS